MNISVGQIYIKPGVSFPFAANMQRWLTDELTRLAGEAETDDGYSLVINVSADLGLEDNKVLGPTKFKKYKTVEYTLFLPYEAISAVGQLATDPTMLKAPWPTCPGSKS